MSALLAFVRADAVLDVPVVPGTWDLTVESNCFASPYPLGRVARPDVFFHARLIARASGQPLRAVFVCTGPAPVLSALAAMVASDALPWTATWASLPALRADGGATAVAIRAQWPDERPGGVGVQVAHWARMAGFQSEDAET